MFFDIYHLIKARRMINIASLVNSIETSDFLLNFLNKKPLISRRSSSSTLSTKLIDLYDIDKIIAQQIYLPYFRMVKNGKAKKYDDISTYRLFSGEVESDIGDPNAIYDGISKGETLVLQFLERYWPPLEIFCASLSQELGSKVQANAYLTPPGSKGFNPHSDTHDVFILQIHGRKEWKVWGCPIPYLTPSVDIDTRTNSSLEIAKNTSPLINIELFPGDTLYIPRGFVHEANTNEVTSLHITLGIIAYTYADLFSSALENSIKKIERNSISRKSIDVSKIFSNSDNIIFDTILDEVVNSISLDALIDEKRDVLRKMKKIIELDGGIFQHQNHNANP